MSKSNNRVRRAAAQGLTRAEGGSAARMRSSQGQGAVQTLTAVAVVLPTQDRLVQRKRKESQRAPRGQGGCGGQIRRTFLGLPQRHSRTREKPRTRTRAPWNPTRMIHSFREPTFSHGLGADGNRLFDHGLPRPSSPRKTLSPPPGTRREQPP